MTQRYIAPSILSANFLELRKDIEMINRSEAHWIHYDVMDGIFVPNISFGLPILKQVNSIAKNPLDVHLMIANPDPYIIPFKEAGAFNITVHYETCPHLNRTINFIKEQGLMASVCLNPHTPVELLEEILPDVAFTQHSFNVMKVLSHVHEKIILGKGLRYQAFYNQAFFTFRKIGKPALGVSPPLEETLQAA